MEYSSISAPIGGMVESTGVEVHDTVSAQNVICVISGEGSKAVSFAVTEKIIGGLQVGDEIRIEKKAASTSEKSARSAPWWTRPRACSM